MSHIGGQQHFLLFLALAMVSISYAASRDLLSIPLSEPVALSFAGSLVSFLRDI
jgi:hypothetical protein